MIRPGGDCRIVIYLHYAEKIGFKTAKLHTPDADIFFILLVHTHELALTVYLDTGIGKHQQLINTSGLAGELGKDWCSTLLGFYVFSQEDCIKYLQGKGKGERDTTKETPKEPKVPQGFQVNYNWISPIIILHIHMLFQINCSSDHISRTMLQKAQHAWEVTTEVQTQLEACTCTMYGQVRESSVKVVRSKLLKKMTK